jgi:hypothetical protein
MVKATIIIKDSKDKTVFSKTWETKNIESAADKFSLMYPDCWVNVTIDSKNFVANQPINMAKDQLLVDSGKLSIGKFMRKWYGKQPTKSQVKSELIEEFGEDKLV